MTPAERQQLALDALAQLTHGTMHATAEGVAREASRIIAGHDRIYELSPRLRPGAAGMGRVLAGQARKGKCKQVRVGYYSVYRSLAPPERDPVRAEMEAHRCPTCGGPAVEYRAQQVTRERPGVMYQRVEPGERRYVCAQGHYFDPDGEPRGESMPPDITIRESVL